MDFTIAENQNTEVIPQVLSVSDTLKFDFITSVTFADNDQHGPIEYTMEVTAKDLALGAIMLTGQFAMTGVGTVHVPTTCGHYTFKAIRLVIFPYVQYFLAAELSENQNLSFEFLPESLDNFIVQEFGDRALKVYLPNDRNKCKLYARVDVAEGIRIEYVYVDRTEASISSVSVLV